MATHTKELLTAQETADYMGISLKLVYQRRWLGIGPQSYKRNNRILAVKRSGA